MEATFRYRRQSCRPLWDVTVRLEAERADGFSVKISPNVQDAFSEEMQRAAMLGIASAFASLDSIEPVMVTVLEVVDHSGSTSEMGLNICAEAAMFQILGSPERAPFPGVFDEA